MCAGYQSGQCCGDIQVWGIIAHFEITIWQGFGHGQATLRLMAAEPWLANKRASPSAVRMVSLPALAFWYDEKRPPRRRPTHDRTRNARKFVPPGFGFARD